LPKSEEKPEITVRRAAMNLLARREQSFFELIQKLTLKYPDFDKQETILPALEKLREENLQSDARFVESYVHYRSSRGMGPLKIEMELNQKGISRSQVRAKLYKEEMDWITLCQEALERKFSDAPVNDLKDKEKRYRFLSQRGFNSEQIRAVLG
jgi:regulatory protein